MPSLYIYFYNIHIIDAIINLQQRVTLIQIFSINQRGPLSLVEECRGLALIGRELHSVATPALLCHKEPARRIQSPHWGALERKITPLGGILLAPSSLVLYGIR